MARKKTTPTEPASEPEVTSTLRRCIGSARYGFEAHDAPIEEFPRQPSQKDGIGRMCKTHWRQYTAGLARDAKARKAAAQPVDQEPAASEAVATSTEGEEVTIG